ncbi:MAG: Ig-like domain-containing protein [Oscillospiraceae bacterium]|nr:Ig-like domain-containing protein [Oscillospiraceae bacterium]
MKKVKRILAIVLAAITTITAISIVANAGIADTAKSITSGKAVTTTLYNYYDCADYKINVAKSGILKLDITAEIEHCNIYVYDVNGNKIPVADATLTSSNWTDKQKGDSYFYSKWNSVTEKFIGTISYGVSKGTYYIRIERVSSKGDGNLKLTATYPTSSTASKGKISYLSVTVNKGSTLQLGAVVSPSGSKVTWKSSKPSIATVSSNGKVTAKKKGSTLITAKCGTKSQKIKIIVK